MKEIEIVNVTTGEVLLEFKSQQDLLNTIFSLIEGRKNYFLAPDGVKYTIKKKYNIPIGHGGFRRTMPKKIKPKEGIITGIKNKKNPLIDNDCLNYENKTT